MKHLAAWVLLALALPGGMIRAAELEGTVLMGSDLPWRGLSLTARQATISVNGYARFEQGSYLGLIASAVEFRGGAGADPRYELQLDLGHAFDLGRGRSLSVGLLQSRYPSAAAALDFSEPYLVLARGRASLAFNYAANYFGGESRSFHTLLSYALPLRDGWTLDLRVADFRFSNEPNAGLVDYRYRGVGLRRRLGSALEGQLRWVDTTPDAVGFRRSRLSFLLTATF